LFAAAAVSAAALPALAGDVELAGHHGSAPAYCPPPPCLDGKITPTPPDGTTQPPQTTPTEPITQTPSDTDFGAQTSGAGFGGDVAINIMGDLLYGSHSVLFRYIRASGGTNVLGSGATSIINPKVAENTSPLPLDRVYYRYNYYNDALSVSGIGNQQITDPKTGIVGQAAAVKFYDAHINTFGLEKTFFDRLMSVEIRVPFVSTLASKIDLSAGQVVGTNGVDANGNTVFQVNNTFGNTFGHDDTEFGDMTVVLKGLLCQTRTLAVSGGLAVGIPTAPDSRIRVTDFSGDVRFQTADIIRTREFRIANDTWSLSPFVAALATPTDRFFAQGFLQFDFPIGDSTINHSSVTNLPGLATFANNVAAAQSTPGYRIPPYSEQSSIGEQTLMHIDIGTGYWLMRCPEARWITGIVPTAELHYTTTLDNAQIVTLTGDPFFIGVPNLEPRPQVGNQRNRMDILDVTLGSTFVIGKKATVAAGVAFPLKGVDNRTFDWEFLFQVNYFFGRSRATPTYQ
jgi:hypothetical protein